MKESLRDGGIGNSHLVQGRTQDHQGDEDMKGWWLWIGQGGMGGGRHATIFAGRYKGMQGLGLQSWSGRFGGKEFCQTKKGVM